jgi:hypothetical protein
MLEGGRNVHSNDTGAGRAGTRSSLEIGKLPPLRIIPAGSLVLHELPDAERWKPLKARIESDGLIKHPPIAARDHGSATHILLDGVNRVEAMRRLGASWLLIQEVDLEDDSLVLSTWHHVVEGMDMDAAVRRIGESARISKVEAGFTAQGDFEPAFDDDTECVLVCRDRSAYAVYAPDDTGERLRVVTAVVDALQAAKNRDRVSYTNMADLTDHYGEFSALVCYRPFTKAGVLAMSLKGRKFPSGVTRFSVPKRALYFDLPLAFLKGRGSAESKQKELDGMIQTRIRSKKIRFYVEPTFIFDD